MSIGMAAASDPSVVVLVSLLPECISGLTCLHLRLARSAAFCSPLPPLRSLTRPRRALSARLSLHFLICFQSVFRSPMSHAFSFLFFSGWGSESSTFLRHLWSSQSLGTTLLLLRWPSASLVGLLSVPATFLLFPSLLFPITLLCVSLLLTSVPHPVHFTSSCPKKFLNFLLKSFFSSLISHLVPLKSWIVSPCLSPPPVTVSLPNSGLLCLSFFFCRRPPPLPPLFIFIYPPSSLSSFPCPPLQPPHPHPPPLTPPPLLPLLYLPLWGCLWGKQPQCRGIRSLTRHRPTCSGVTHRQAAIELVRLASRGTWWLQRGEGGLRYEFLFGHTGEVWTCPRRACWQESQTG